MLPSPPKKCLGGLPETKKLNIEITNTMVLIQFLSQGTFI